MQITEIELKDFGQHKHLKFACDTPVVGLLGKNGCGKSTVLSAIQMAFTGTAGSSGEKTKLETYVRNGGQEGAANNGSVRLKFRKNGMEGELFRQIGKTDKRTLSWDGKEYTKAKDIEPILAEILGADKQAISAAIFIQQGELDKLLFGSQAEREQLFVKLMLLGYMEKTAAHIDGRMIALASTVVDLAPQHDLIGQQLEAATQSLMERNQRSRESIDYFDELANLRSYETHSKATEELNTIVARYKRELTDKQQISRQVQERIAVELSCDASVSKAELQRSLDSTTEQIHQLDKRLERLDRVEDARVKFSQYSAARAAGELRVEELNKQLGRFPSGMEEKLASTTSQISDLEKHAQKRKELADIQTALSEIKEQILQAEALVQGYDAEEIQRLGDQQLELDALYSRTNLELGMLQDMLKSITKSAGGVDTAHCPLCESKVQNITENCTRRIADLTLKRSECAKAVAVSVDRRKSLIEGKQAAVNALSGLTGQRHQLTQRFTQTLQQVGKLPPGDLESLQKDQVCLQRAVDESRRLKEELRGVAHTVDKQNALIAGIPEELVVESKRKDAAGIALEKSEVAAQVQNLKNRQGSISAALEAIRNADQAYYLVLNQLSDAQARQKQALEAAQFSYDKLLDETKIYLGTGTVENTLASLETAQAQYQALQGERKAAATLCADLQRKLEELAVKKAAEAGKIQLVEDLKKLKDMFSRRALPLAFIRHRFSRLSRLTNSDLSKMDADFSVEEDPDRAVSFLFTRTDNDSGYVMPQEKLSGGQRVRLSVAFLLAFQRLVIPDVGLLVYDEPSMHLDPEGVEGLVEVIQGLGNSLQDAEAQVWVVDHNPALDKAFGTTINLSGGK